MKRLLTSLLLQVSKKYSLLREEPACIELRKFLQNFELIQTALGNLESALLDELSKESEVRQAVETVNENFARASHIANNRVHFLHWMLSPLSGAMTDRCILF